MIVIYLERISYKLHVHVVEVVMEIAFERIAIVKISEGRTQPIGAGGKRLAYTLLPSFER